MKKLLYLTAILIQFGLTGLAQVPDLIRTPITPASGVSRNNRAVSDANLYIPYSLRIPRASAFTLNGAKDSIGYIMFNTTSNRIGVYKGGGVWDTYLTSADIPAGVTSFNSRTGAVVPLTGDYSSFYPLLDGTGATGNWNINASTVTNGVYTSRLISTNPLTGLLGGGTLGSNLSLELDTNLIQTKSGASGAFVKITGDTLTGRLVVADNLRLNNVAYTRTSTTGDLFTPSGGGGGGSSQGVTTDGTYNYVVRTTGIMKYNSDYSTLVAQKTSIFTGVPNIAHASSIKYYNGLLYVPASESGTTSTLPGAICVYDPTTLNLVAYYPQASLGLGVTGICFDGTYAYSTAYTELATTIWVRETTGFTVVNTITIQTPIPYPQGIALYNNRFYFFSLRGIYSCAKDGSDVQKHYNKIENSGEAEGGDALPNGDLIMACGGLGGSLNNQVFYYTRGTATHRLFEATSTGDGYLDGRLVFGSSGYVKQQFNASRSANKSYLNHVDDNLILARNGYYKDDDGLTFGFNDNTQNITALQLQNSGGILRIALADPATSTVTWLNRLSWNSTTVNAPDITVATAARFSYLTNTAIPYIGASGLLSNDAANFFWTTASKKLSIVGGTDAANYPGLLIQNNGGGSANSASSIVFSNTTTTANHAQIQAIRTNVGGSQAHDFIFSLHNGTTLTDRMRLYANGSLWLNTITSGTAGTDPIVVRNTTDGLLKTISGSYYQQALVSGTNIKTVNSNSLLGSGNVSVGTVTSASGTTNRITVATGTTTPVIDISATFEALLGKVANPLSQFASTTSAQLRTTLSDETGTGSAYFQGGDIGTPSAGVATNLTGTAAGLTAGAVTNGVYTTTGGEVAGPLSVSNDITTNPFASTFYNTFPSKGGFGINSSASLGEFDFVSAPGNGGIGVGGFRWIKLSSSNVKTTQMDLNGTTNALTVSGPIVGTLNSASGTDRVIVQSSTPTGELKTRTLASFKTDFLTGGLNLSSASITNVNTLSLDNGNYWNSAIFSHGRYTVDVSGSTDIDNRYYASNAAQYNIRFNGSNGQHSWNFGVAGIQNWAKIDSNGVYSLGSKVITETTGDARYVDKTSTQTVTGFKTFDNALISTSLPFSNGTAFAVTLGIGGAPTSNTVVTIAPNRTGSLAFNGDIPIAGSFSSVGAATTTFTVTIGTTMANNTYKVPTPGASNVLSAAPCYITNKTTTTFDVVYLTGLTGTVSFDWVVVP